MTQKIYYLNKWYQMPDDTYQYIIDRHFSDLIWNKLTKEQQDEVIKELMNSMTEIENKVLDAIVVKE